MKKDAAMESIQTELDMVIFGGAGDLSVRKLLPALYMAFVHKNLPPQSKILVLGRQAWTDAEFTDFVGHKARPFVDAQVGEEGATDADWQAFLACLKYVKIDVNQSADYVALGAALRDGAQRVFYLSTAPSLFTAICENLSAAGLNSANSRVVLEKPLGSDLASSQVINDVVGAHFAESQIYRIDHYLGKETVQNLMVLRFGNSIFEPLWRTEHIKSVQITVAETVGVGSRAGFYDGTGAMRDMVQNHLLQLLCIVAMEPPVSLEANAVRDEKLKVLRSLRPMTVAEVAQNTVRGQYGAGTVEGKAVLAYRDEDNVPEDSGTETFVSICAHINNWRWAKVPFFLRTGKRMQQKISEIVVEFDALPFSIFESNTSPLYNRLRIQLQPEESVTLEMMAKEPGSGMKLRPVKLNLDLQSAFSERRAEAYERLLMDVVHGRLTHFMRRDELEAAWKWVDPIIDAWQQMGEPPRSYAAGTWGPAASSALMARADTTWIEEV